MKKKIAFPPIFLLCLPFLLMFVAGALIPIAFCISYRNTVSMCWTVLIATVGIAADLTLMLMLKSRSYRKVTIERLLKSGLSGGQLLLGYALFVCGIGFSICLGSLHYIDQPYLEDPAYEFVGYSWNEEIGAEAALFRKTDGFVMVENFRILTDRGLTTTASFKLRPSQRTFQTQFPTKADNLGDMLMIIWLPFEGYASFGGTTVCKQLMISFGLREALICGTLGGSIIAFSALYLITISIRRRTSAQKSNVKPLV